MTLARRAGAAGAFAGFLFVALGAVGSHALATRLDAHAQELWRTATLYLGVHAVALLAVAALAQVGALPLRELRRVAVLFGVGSVLFCGSVYALALGAPRGLGAVAPLGGMAWLLGWAVLAWAWLRAPARPGQGGTPL